MANKFLSLILICLFTFAQSKLGLGGLGDIKKIVANAGANREIAEANR